MKTFSREVKIRDWNGSEMSSFSKVVLRGAKRLRSPPRPTSIASHLKVLPEGMEATCQAGTFEGILGEEKKLSKLYLKLYFLKAFI